MFEPRCKTVGNSSVILGYWSNSYCFTGRSAITDIQGLQKVDNFQITFKLKIMECWEFGKTFKIYWLLRVRYNTDANEGIRILQQFKINESDIW